LAISSRFAGRTNKTGEKKELMKSLINQERKIEKSEPVAKRQQLISPGKTENSKRVHTT